MGRTPWILLVGALFALGLGACSEGSGGDGASGSDGGVVGGNVPEAEGLTQLIIAPQSATLTPGTPKQFSAIGEYATGETKDLTAVAQWSTDNPELVEIDNGDQKGLATVHAAGRITITARVGGTEATLTIGRACAYPEGFPAQIRLGEVVPPFGFTGYGANSERVEFSMEDWACDDTYETVHFLLGTGWCGACSALAQRTSTEAEAIRAAGGLVVYVELEDSNSNPVGSEGARDHYDRLIGPNTTGLRVGDLSTLPAANFLGTAASGIINGYPTTFSVRRRDMQVIAVDQPFLAVSQDPERDWTQPFVPEFMNNCEEGQDEASEPNDTAEQAAPLAAGTHSGGICTAAGDFYQVDIEGPWRFSMTFSHATGDLDVYVWDVAQDGPLQVGGRPVGSDGTADGEMFEHEGPALVHVLGHRGASAPYEITLEAL